MREALRVADAPTRVRVAPADDDAPELPVRALRLGRADLWASGAKPGRLKIGCVTGRVWVSQSGQDGDVELAPGEVCVTHTHGKVVLCCLDDALMGHLYEVRDLGVQLGRPVLPVVARALDVEVGPLLVPQTAHHLESRMVQPGAAGKGVGRDALSLFSAPPSRPLSSDARASLGGLLAQAAWDPWGLLAWSRHWVCPGACSS